MANKRKLRLPSQGKVKREDFLVEGHLLETQRREPVEITDQAEILPTVDSSNPNSAGVGGSSSVKANQDGGDYGE